MNTKKIIAAILAAVMVLSLAACGGNGDADPTAVPATDAPEQVTTAPTDAPTAVPEGYVGENLLDWIIDAEGTGLIVPDSWTSVEGGWTGPSYESRASTDNPENTGGQTLREFVEDPEKGTCYRWASNITEGYHITGNSFGIEDVIEYGKKYRLTVELKYTTPTPNEFGDNVGVGASCSRTPAIAIEAKDEWQTITYEFTAEEHRTYGAYIYISPLRSSAPNDEWGMKEIDWMQAGFELLVSSVSLCEIG